MGYLTYLSDAGKSETQLSCAPRCYPPAVCQSFLETRGGRVDDRGAHPRPGHLGAPPGRPSLPPRARFSSGQALRPRGCPRSLLSGLGRLVLAADRSCGAQLRLGYGSGGQETALRALGLKSPHLAGLHLQARVPACRRGHACREMTCGCRWHLSANQGGKHLSVVAVTRHTAAYRQHATQPECTNQARQGHRGRGRAALCGTRGESQSQGAAPIQGLGARRAGGEPPVQTGPACA